MEQRIEFALKAPMRADIENDLIASRRPDGIRAHTCLARIIGKLHAATVAYRFWFGKDGQRQLAGW